MPATTKRFQRRVCCAVVPPNNFMLLLLPFLFYSWAVVYWAQSETNLCNYLVTSYLVTRWCTMRVFCSLQDSKPGTHRWVPWTTPRLFLLTTSFGKVSPNEMAGHHFSLRCDKSSLRPGLKKWNGSSIWVHLHRRGFHSSHLDIWDRVNFMAEKKNYFFCLQKSFCRSFLKKKNWELHFQVDSTKVFFRI